MTTEGTHSRYTGGEKRKTTKISNVTEDVGEIIFFVECDDGREGSVSRDEMD